MTTAPPILRIVRDDEVLERVVRDTIVPPLAPRAIGRVDRIAVAGLPAPELDAPPPAARRWRSQGRRLAVLGLVAAALFGLSWSASQIYYLVSDGWIAPVRLSPDSAAVTQLQLEHQRLVAEIARLDAEVAQLDGDAVAIEVSIGALSGLRQRVQARPAEQVRLEVELERLAAELRGDRALRAGAAASAIAQRSQLAELEAQPLYRALTRATDVAFVPGDPQPDRLVGARVMACVWSVLQCREVGRIAAIVPGEVTGPDPHGALTRGRYAQLALDDRSATAERVLRVRH